MESVSEFDSYPLRQWVMSGDACFRDAGCVVGMCKADRYLLKSDGVSARLFAVSECALDEARSSVQAAYGPLVIFGPAEIHNYLDAPSGRTMQPVMVVRVQAQRAFVDVIYGELQRRLATAVEGYVKSDLVVVQAEVSLSRLLGCPKTLKHLTHTSTAIWTWLLRYQPSPI